MSLCLASPRLGPSSSHSPLSPHSPVGPHSRCLCSDASLLSQHLPHTSFYYFFLLACSASSTAAWIPSPPSLPLRTAHPRFCRAGAGIALPLRSQRSCLMAFPFCLALSVPAEALIPCLCERGEREGAEAAQQPGSAGRHRGAARAGMLAERRSPSLGSARSHWLLGCGSEARSLGD